MWRTAQLPANRGTKRPRDEEEEELKRPRKQDGTGEHGHFGEEGMTVEKAADYDQKRLLQIMAREDEEKEEEEELFDASSVKKIILTFEKGYTKTKSYGSSFQTSQRSLWNLSWTLMTSLKRCTWQPPGQTCIPSLWS